MIVALVDESVRLRDLETRNGRESDWYDAHVIDMLRELGHQVLPLRFNADLARAVTEIRAARPELVFNLTRNVRGSGAWQAHAATVLDLLDVPYTGSDPRGLQLANDKGVAKSIVARQGVGVPNFVAMRAPAVEPYPYAFPAIVKPLMLGGSVGIKARSIVHDGAALRAGVRALHKTCSDVICEEFVDGRELAVWVLGNVSPRVLPIVEWRFPARGLRILTERAKWDRASRAVSGISAAPAKLTAREERNVRDAAVAVFRALGLRDYAKIELRLKADGTPIMLEANANPGLRPTPAQYGWVPFPKIVQSIVRNAKTRVRRERGR
jgi:D-alanine-D-alanine ligase